MLNGADFWLRPQKWKYRILKVAVRLKLAKNADLEFLNSIFSLLSLNQKSALPKMLFWSLEHNFQVSSIYLENCIRYNKKWTSTSDKPPRPPGPAPRPGSWSHGIQLGNQLLFAVSRHNSHNHRKHGWYNEVQVEERRDRIAGNSLLVPHHVPV